MTSPTIPLASSQLQSQPTIIHQYMPVKSCGDIRARRDLGGRLGETSAEEAEDESERKWEALLSSGGYMSDSPPLSSDTDTAMDWEEEICDAEHEQNRKEADGGEVLPDEFEPPPTSSGSTTFAARYRTSSIAPIGKDSSVSIEDILMTPHPLIPSIKTTPQKGVLLGDEAVSPFNEAQLEPGDMQDWPMSPSPPSSPLPPIDGPSTSIDSRPIPVDSKEHDKDGDITIQAEAPHPFSESQRSRRKSASYHEPAATASLAVDVSLNPPSERHPPTPPTADPALERFRTTRTFRTRTTLQLQPYTKERQIYEAALRRGGLKKGKRAVARERDISPSEEDDEPEGEVDNESEAAVDPDEIVIGNTPPEPRHREPKELIDADYDEYFMTYGESPLDDDPRAVERLQKIARVRLRAAREERKRKRQEEKLKRDFERFIHEDARAEEDSTNSEGVSASSRYLAVEKLSAVALLCPPSSHQAVQGGQKHTRQAKDLR